MDAMVSCNKDIRFPNNAKYSSSVKMAQESVHDQQGESI